MPHEKKRTRAIVEGSAAALTLKEEAKQPASRAGAEAERAEGVFVRGGR